MKSWTSNLECPPSEITGILQAFHIVPFALGGFTNKTNKRSIQNDSKTAKKSAKESAENHKVFFHYKTTEIYKGNIWEDHWNAYI